ncbi:MAG TPA: hypothetical protein VGW75_09645 [Solirubrobacteraceae bacterium]|nr:hypothetical protein [Solirubrobacteraceae bacterium]
MGVVLVVAVVLGTLAVVAAGDAARRARGSTRWHGVAAAVAVSAGTAVGAAAFAGREPDVTTSSALTGGVVAALAVAALLFGYYALGAFVRSRRLKVACWVVTLPALYRSASSSSSGSPA